MKKIPHILLGAGALIGIGLMTTANATPNITSPYALCVYKGNTTFSSALTGAEATCYLTLVAKASCTADGSGNHHFHVVAAGAVPGEDATCSAIATGGFPWGGDMTAAGGIVGGQIDTGHNPLGLPSVGSFNPGPFVWDVSALGIVTGITGNNPTASPCTGGNQVPQTISVASGGALNFGGVASFDTLGPNHLSLRSCVLQ
ncbi:hypothetical protein [Isoalcanivorax pacificus]|uniref:hypothetical protein n=1 Tax=Isoalcanivorax pacificus TaxID=1306787 RepID=UPI001186287C|nr:hypothetical protein [Isoalcanivorax pacificus]